MMIIFKLLSFPFLISTASKIGFLHLFGF